MPILTHAARWLLLIGCVAALGCGLWWTGLSSGGTTGPVEPASLTGPARPARAASPTPPRTPPLEIIGASMTPRAPESPSPNPAPACLNVYPIERVEALTTQLMTIPQLEAAFGRASAIGGRATRLRFEARGCTLLITPGDTGAQEVELVAYGALDWLLARYGDPATTAITQGNLVWPISGDTVLLYPDQGIIAIFSGPPDTLSPDTPIASLLFRPAYRLDAQLRRMNLRPMER